MFRLAVCIVAIVIDCFRQLFKRAFLAIEERLGCAGLVESTGPLDEASIRVPAAVMYLPPSRLCSKEEKITNAASDHRYGVCILQVQRRQSVQIPVNCPCERSQPPRVAADCSYPQRRVNLSVSNAIQTQLQTSPTGGRMRGPTPGKRTCPP